MAAVVVYPSSSVLVTVPTFTATISASVTTGFEPLPAPSFQQDRLTPSPFGMSAVNVETKLVTRESPAPVPIAACATLAGSHEHRSRQGCCTQESNPPLRWR